MNLIPDEELKRNGSVNLAPMVDFLFLVLAVFATLAITRAALFDTDISLVKLTPESAPSSIKPQENYFINLSIDEQGHYKLISEGAEYLMPSIDAIRAEIIHQQEVGLLPKEKQSIKVLLHIDKKAQWDAIIPIIFGMKESGFTIHPVYETKD